MIKALIAIAWIIACTLSLIRQDHPFIAALWLLPWIALAASVHIPGRGFGHFALTVPIAGPVPNEHEPQSAHQFKLARWWALASLALPLAFATFVYSIAHDHLIGSFEAVLAIPFPVFGIACLLKCITSLVSGYRAYRHER